MNSSRLQFANCLDTRDLNCDRGLHSRSRECTIAVAETSRRDIHWLHPLDFDVAELSFEINDGPASISSNDTRGPLVLFADGAVYRLNPTIDAGTLKSLITIGGNEDVSRDRLIARGLLIEP